MQTNRMSVPTLVIGGDPCSDFPQERIPLLSRKLHAIVILIFENAMLGRSFTNLRLACV